MIKKMTLAIVMMFCMVSLATAAANYDYITFPEEGVIEVKLLEVPGDEWGMWDIMLYDFIDDGNGNITVNGMLDLFYDNNSQGDIIYLTINDNVISNGFPNCDDCYNELKMSSSNLGIAFAYGPDEDTTIWYSHASLNDGDDLFNVITNPEDPGNGMVEWFSGTDHNPGEMVGMIDMRVNNAPVPIPGAIWLLGSGLIGLIAFRKRN